MAAQADQNGTQQVPARRLKNRKQLLFEFDMQRDTHESGQYKRDYFIGDAYPPSIKSINDLQTTSIGSLPSNVRAEGKVLFVRTLETGIAAAGVHNIVEDFDGFVERLALYNSHDTARATKLQLKGGVIAVKEPILEFGANGSSCIRVDHPSDLLYYPQHDPRLPSWALGDAASNDSDNTAGDFKTKGNASYKAGNFIFAVLAFTQGLKVCREHDQTIQRDLHRNRAIANTYLKRYESALSDAIAAIIPIDDTTPDEQTTSLNSKAHFRAGRAAYELRRFREAKDHFATAQKLTPADKDTQRELNRADERLHEQTTGKYDFERVGSSVSKKHNRLDYADFLSNIEARDAGSHGNGLFATKDLNAGELILCEKAFAVAFDSDKKATSLTILDDKSHRQLTGTQSSLFFDLVAKLLHSPESAESFFRVYDAGYPFKQPAKLVDEAVPVDAFRVQAIVQHNSFGCPTVRTTSEEAKKQSTSSTGYPSTGLWITAAYTNHACNGNAMRSFMGDMMIMRATRNIPKGEEILMPYRLPSADHETTQAELKKIWGFTCDCSLCAAERKTSRTQRQQRMKLIEEITTLLNANPLRGNERPKDKVVDQISKRMVRLESTYDEQAFEGKPRLGLVAPGLWLCKVYSSKSLWEDVLKTTMGVLRNLGYIVEVSEKTISINRAYCHLVGEAIAAAIFASRAFQKLERTELQKQMDAFARELYETLNGEMRGFEENLQDD